MTQESMPFFDSAEEATRHAILVSGKNPKSVGAALWPDKTAEAARTALMNALNPNRDERLTADQHLFVANFCSQYDYVYYVCHRCNHSRPKLQTPEDQLERLRQDFYAATDLMKDLVSQIDSAKARLAGAAR